MSTKTTDQEQSVSELLSGYIDGELTQQQRQRVELLCETDEECRRNLEELTALRERIGQSRLGEASEEHWGERMNDSGVKATSMIGWILFIGGVLIALGVFVLTLLFDPSIDWLAKLVMVAIYGGLATLLVSVLRQRLIERKTDKYKNVRI